jgi:hypothetical protein
MHLKERLVAAGRLSVTARIRPDTLDDEGPGRILSLSRSTLRRNFTLGQSGAEVSFRVRTPAVGKNGIDPHAITFGAPLTRATHEIRAVFDGRTSRVFVDGVCRGDSLVALAGVPVARGDLVTVSVAGCSALGALALGTFAAPRRRLRIGLAVAGGAATFGGLWGVGFWSHLPGFDARLAAVALAATAAAIALLWDER